jgi:hypothetical protein
LNNRRDEADLLNRTKLSYDFSERSEALHVEEKDEGIGINIGSP